MSHRRESRAHGLDRKGYKESSSRGKIVRLDKNAQGYQGLGVTTSNEVYKRPVMPNKPFGVYCIGCDRSIPQFTSSNGVWIAEQSTCPFCSADNKDETAAKIAARKEKEEKRKTDLAMKRPVDRGHIGRKIVR